jgi:hypothetical protein
MASLRLDLGGITGLMPRFLRSSRVASVMQDLRTAVHSLLASRSWRITAPFRAIKPVLAFVVFQCKCHGLDDVDIPLSPLR